MSVVGQPAGYWVTDSIVQSVVAQVHFPLPPSFCSLGVHILRDAEAPLQLRAAFGALQGPRWGSQHGSGAT